MALLTWLTGENRALKQLNKELMEANAMVVDDYFDLQVEYERLFDECLSKKQDMKYLIALMIIVFV